MANDNTPGDQPSSYPSPEPDPWATTPRQRLDLPPEGEPSPYARPADNPWQAPQPEPSQPEPTKPYPIPDVNPYAQQFPTTPPPPAGPPAAAWGPGSWTPPPAAPSTPAPAPYPAPTPQTGPGGWRPDANPISALFDFSFTKFATPGLVKIVYILQVVAAVGAWLIWVLGAFAADRFGGGFGSGLLVLLVGWVPVLLSIAFTRFVLEGIVALIRIHDRVAEMAERSKDAPSA